jgi:alpha 1,3-glucosidase
MSVVFSNLQIRNCYQVGAWLYPFFRSHAHHRTSYREVYTLEGEPREVASEAINDRYRLLPYWYTLAKLGNLRGIPIVRPLWWEFTDERFADVDDIAMLGSGLLIVPFLDEGNAPITVVLPNERWYRWEKLNEVVNTLEIEYNGGRTGVLCVVVQLFPLRE